MCREIVWKYEDQETGESEIEKYAERVDPLDEVPAYVRDALLDYDSNYGPVRGVVNPVDEEDTEVPDDPGVTLDAYFQDAERPEEADSHD